MGVRGLTTFIANRSERFLENYQLSDTTLVVDGLSVACQLYTKCRPNERNDCFGGDYDKYRSVVEDFFQMLKACNVTPLIIFDGGYEKRKIKTVLDRIKHRIKDACDLSRGNTSRTLFPILAKDLFAELAIKNGFKCVRCEFEADSETASLARSLKCPVLSYDSDFYIFDVLYIPFSTLNFHVRNTNGKNYIACQVYRVEKLLDWFGGMNKLNLPILAVLLGNDYVQKNVFAAFFRHLKLQKGGSGHDELQRRIKTLIMWLKNETPESAIMKVVRRFKLAERRGVAKILESSIKGYHFTDSEFLKHFNVDESKTVDLNFPKIEAMEAMPEIEEERGAEAIEEIDFEDIEIDEKCKYSDNVLNLPQFFRDDFRNCLYSGCFIDMITTSTYYCIVQVEDVNQKLSHTVCFNIISAFHKILTGKSELQIIGRDGKYGFKKNTLPPYDKNLPALKDLEHLPIETCKTIFLDILDIDDSLGTFPQSWHLLIITIKYWIKHAKVNWSSIYSILLCAIIVNCVDKKIGFYRSTRPFLNRYGSHTSSTSYTPQTSIAEALDEIDLDNSVASMKKLIDFFQTESNQSRSNPFDMTIIHDFAVFQSCLFNIKLLNSLFKFPFRQLEVSQFYNGTFLYNMTVNLNKRTNNMDKYVKVLLEGCPKVLNTFELMAVEVKKYLPDSSIEEFQ